MFVLLWTSAVLVAVVIAAIIFFVGKEGLTTFQYVSPGAVLASWHWAPPEAFGLLIFVLGSLASTALAMVIAVPIGLAGAVFLAKESPEWLRVLMRPATNLFVGIPSVVYGYVGMTVFVPLARRISGGVGFGLGVAGIILAVMILPTIISISEDAIRSVDPVLEEGSLALGATRWETISKVILPAARPGILASVILAFARAFGETTAVQMVIGNAPVFPQSLFHPTSTLTSEIIQEMGQTPPGTAWYYSLFLMAFGLLATSLAAILVVRMVARRGEVAS
ncbi:MAG: phosphate ABC transporter permease subunit PstC [Symbiobacteriia bacterium]